MERVELDSIISKTRLRIVTKIGMGDDVGEPLYHYAIMQNFTTIWWRVFPRVHTANIVTRLVFLASPTPCWVIQEPSFVFLQLTFMWLASDHSIIASATCCNSDAVSFRIIWIIVVSSKYLCVSTLAGRSSMKIMMMSGPSQEPKLNSIRCL